MKFLTIAALLALAHSAAADTGLAGARGQNVVATPFITALGGTNAGKALFQMPNVSAVRYLRLNADNTVSQLDAAAFLTAIGGGAGGGGSGSVTSVSVTSANGISGSVAAATSTPAISLTLGAITPTSVAATGPVTGSNLSGANSGDNAANSLYSGLVTNATHTGDATGATALTLATVNSNVGTFGSSTHYSTVTVNGKGLVTAASQTPWPTFNQSTTGNSATVTTINGRIAAGTNVSLSGSGTAGSPYVISATSGGAVILTSGDGRQVETGAMTSASASLSATGAAFVSGDVGKSIVVQGAGASGADLVTTIAAYSSASVVTLAAAAGTTVTSRTVTFGSDQTAAIQSAIDTCATRGGKIYLPAGIYMVAGALDTSANGQTYNAQITLPMIADTAVQRILEIYGDSKAGYPYLQYTGSKPPDHGTILFTTAAGTGSRPSMIGGPLLAADNFSHMGVIIRDITFRNRNNPSVALLDLKHINTVEIDHVTCDTDCNTYVLIQPSSIDATAIHLPTRTNNARASIRSTYVMGHYYGIIANEHTVLDDVFVQSCYYGLAFNGTFHQTQINKLVLHQCPYGVAFVGDTYLFANIDFERYTNGGPAWMNPIADIYDPDNHGFGKIYYQAVRAGVGVNGGELSQTGGNNLSVVWLGDIASDGGGSPAPTTSLLARFKADDLALADNTTVTTWTKNGSSSGSNATAAGAPKLRTNQVNSTHSAVRFNGAGDYFDGTLDLSGTAATLFAVVKWDSTAGNQARLLGLRKNVIGADDHGFTSSSPSGVAITVPEVTSTATVGSYRAGSTRAVITAPAGAWCILCWKFDGTNSAISINGGAFVTAASTGAFDSQIFRIGGANQQGVPADAFFKGDLAEIALYQGLRSNPEIAAEIATLGTTYGITIP